MYIEGVARFAARDVGAWERRMFPVNEIATFGFASFRVPDQSAEVLGTVVTVTAGSVRWFVNADLDEFAAAFVAVHNDRKPRAVG